MPGLEVRLVKDCKLFWLAKGLTRKFKGNRERITHDFPAAGRRYGSFLRSLKRVLQLRYTNNPLTFAIVLHGEAIGLATLLNTSLMGSGSEYLTEIVVGPNVSLWMGKHQDRPGGTRGLMVFVLQLLALQVKQHKLPGMPWTLVRQEHHQSVNCLTDPQNGFGGFTMLRPAGDYSHVDGSPAYRAVYAATGWYQGR